MPRGSCLCDAVRFEVAGRDWTAVGAFEAPTGTRLARRIFTADKGDYYAIEGALPKHKRPPGAPPASGRAEAG